MEQKFIRACLVIVWNCPAVRDPALRPEKFFGEGAKIGMRDNAILFESAEDAESGLSDEITFGPARLTLASPYPERIPKYFHQVWEIFRKIEGINLIAAGYNAEYEWLGMGVDSAEWIATNFIRKDAFGEKKAKCTSVSFALEGDRETGRPFFLTLEPRSGYEDALFALVVLHFDEIPKELDTFVEGIIPFASRAGTDIVEASLPRP